METNDILKKPITEIKSVGEARAKLFAKLNIFTVEDVITHYPREYEDRTALKKINELLDQESCSFKGTIASAVFETRFKKNLTVYKVHIKDETGIITAVWYNQRFIKNIFHIGEKYMFFGKISRKYGMLEVLSPVYEKIDEKDEKNPCRILPIYPATSKLTQNIIRTTVKNALDMVSNQLDEVLPKSIKRTYCLSDINYSINNIHFPKSFEDYKNSRYRLAFEELLILQLGLSSIKRHLNSLTSGIKFKKCDEVSDFIKSLPFELTPAQKKVIEEIEADMESDRVMNRLVQGDVGSGKTIVAAVALFKAVKNGFQGALMAPTEILAEQHYSSLRDLFERFGVKVALLTGSVGKKDKAEILKQISDGNIDIIIGTHALLEDNVAFQKLGLVITDEQHRFGVRQRAVLSHKGMSPDTLVMTATPIPRTLALILYGDLDISIIDQLPPGRKPIKTYAVDESMRERINNFIKKEVAQGRQAYIVCPLIEKSESVEANSAVEIFEKYKNHDFRDLKVGLIHGKMKPQEKEETMKSFAKGEINILVSTTVIEVGVNVPNATLMIVENAERFGLAQLHQLRGRVGRGSHQSYCILFNESKSKIAKERMKVMESTNDGFVISEKDLELRGPGDFFGTRQHGIPELKIANLYNDMDILKKAQAAALTLLSEDPGLDSEENRKLKEKVMEKFRYNSDTLSFN